MNAHFRNSDDEEDLETLRLAALQSLKRRSPPRTGDGRSQFLNNGRHRRGGGKFGGRPIPNWNPQSGHQFNNWTRNSNLISVPVISNDDKNQSGEQTPAPKLILPQDRYCNAGKPANKVETENNSQSSKFDRYNDSDQSEESESEIEDQNQLNQGGSEKDEENKPLTRHDSLEALMAELENEIQGGSATGNKKPDSSGTTVKKSKESDSSTKEGKSPKVKSASKKPANKPSECDSSTQQPVTATVTTADSSVTIDSLAKENQQPPEVSGDYVQQNVTSSPPFERKRSPEFTRSGEFGGRKYYDENRFLHRKRHKWEAPSYTNRHSFPLPQQMAAHTLGLPPSPIKAGGDLILPPFQSSVPPPNIPQRLPLIPGGPPPPPGVLPPGAAPGFLPYNLQQQPPPQQQHPMPFENSSMLFGQQQQRVPPPVPVIFDVPPPHLATAAAARALAATVFDPQKRPLSPLTINTTNPGGGSLPATTFGQLSPRSAAFVLENRAIIEKRKRRSYSRSPSPPSPPPPSRYNSRRSKSPPPMMRRKSFSPLPIRRRSSLSPLPPPSRRILSPPKHSSGSGSRGGAATKTDSSSANSNSKNAGTSPKKPIHDRLGVKSTSSSTTTASTSASNNKTDATSADNDKNKKSTTSSSSSSSTTTNNRDEKKSEILLDPVLEARRRKFESNQITMKEGVIRLNKAKEPTDKQPEKKDLVGKVQPRKIPEGSSSPKVGNAAKQVPVTPSTTTTTTKSKEVDSSPKLVSVDNKVANLSSTSTLTLKTGSSSDLDLNLSDIDEDALLEEDPEEALLRVLFSDEESNSDNEGRFKVEQQSGNTAQKKVTVLPFTKLVNNGTSTTTGAAAAKKPTTDQRNASSRNRTGSDKNTTAGRLNKVGNTDRNSPASSTSTMKKRFRSRSPLSKRADVGGRAAKKIASDRGNSGSSGKPSSSVPQFPLESSRKIEIKIRNPSKYEQQLGGVADESATNSGGRHEEQPNKTVNISSGSGGNSSVRKVELASRRSDAECAPSSSGKNKEESLSAPASNAEEADGKVNEGDLRAQLSRKRAERQKHPLPDVVPSRLLQNALQEVGFKKAKKHKKSKEEMPDGKLPIHLRLGLAAEKSPETLKSFSKKSRKRSKNKGSGSGGSGNNLEQDVDDSPNSASYRWP